MPVVSFDQEEFKAIYPQFADFTEQRLRFFFEAACQIVDNTERSRVPYDPDRGVTARKVLLYLLVCHLGELSIRGDGVAGQVSSVSEGSVSVSFGASQSQNAQWYEQTQCGATAWKMMLGYVIGGRLYNGCFR